MTRKTSNICPANISAPSTSSSCFRLGSNARPGSRERRDLWVETIRQTAHASMPKRPTFKTDRSFCRRCAVRANANTKCLCSIRTSHWIHWTQNCTVYKRVVFYFIALSRNVWRVIDGNNNNNNVSGKIQSGDEKVTRRSSWDVFYYSLKRSHWMKRWTIRTQQRHNTRSNIQISHHTITRATRDLPKSLTLAEGMLGNPSGIFFL